MASKIPLFLVLAVCVLCSASINDKLRNKNVERVIDLSSQLVKVTATITLENAGSSPAKMFHIMLEPTQHGNLSFLSVKDGIKEDLPVSLENPKENVYVVKLKQAINPDRSSTFHLEYVITKGLTPYPSNISQKEKQLVRYFGNHYFYSPYKTLKQTTSVTLSSRNIENYTKLKPVSQSDSTIMYGPYSDIAPKTVDTMTIHFENNAPFLTVTRLERLIEISHWGNIAVQEDIEILHTGAKLKGPFSRYDYQRDTSNTHHSIKSYRTILPAAAHSIYYRDSNGNISTSQVRYRKDWIELELRPRFPLFGGWKSSYTLGYSVPSYQYLFKTDGTTFKLNMRLLDHVFDDMHVEELETYIVLPVGVRNPKLNFPYEVKELPESITHKYLDTFMGRKVIRLRKENLVEHHIQDVEIAYDWQPYLLFYEPILITIALYFLFLLVIIYVRLDFSIHKSEHIKSQ